MIRLFSVALVALAVLSSAGCGDDTTNPDAGKAPGDIQAERSQDPPLDPAADTDGDGVNDPFDEDPNDAAVPGSDETATTAEDDTSITSTVDPESCAARRISGESIPRQDRKEGACVDATGNRVKIVNKATKLTLPELDITFSGYRTTKTLSASTGTEAASGTYVIATFTVTNKLPGAVAVEPEQFELNIGTERDSRTFTHDFDAMNMPGDSFVWESDEIQPGNTKSGTVVFDVSSSSLKRIGTSGNISILQFSDADGEEPERTVGVIRLYK